MDVSEEILQKHLFYGGSDYTGAHTLSSARALNYAKGASIHNPIKERLEILPYTFHYQDAVGLFGTENCFIRVDLNIDLSVALKCVEEPYWECAEITDIDDSDSYYNAAIIDARADLETVNDYEPAGLKADKIPRTSREFRV